MTIAEVLEIVERILAIHEVHDADFLASAIVAELQRVGALA